MKKSLSFLFILFFLLFGVFIFLYTSFKSSSQIKLAYDTKIVEINSTKIAAFLANSPEKQQLGLGKRRTLNASDGMLFPFTPKYKPYFWMKEMLIPIDIIWIADGKIIQVDANVSTLPPGTPDYKLPIYTPPAPIDYVLEVNANFCKTHNIKVGDSVVIR